MPPVDIVALDHIVLRVADLDRATRFYRDVLGCSVEKWQEDLGLLQLRAGAALIDLVPLDGKLGRAGGAGPGSEGRNCDHFCLRVAKFDAVALRDHFAAHGIALDPPAERYGAEGYGLSIYLTDPDGNVVELKAPKPA